MIRKVPNNWVEIKMEDVVEIMDNMRKPVSASERSKRIGEIPYYGATGKAGTIDDYLFDEELVLLGEDGAPFLDGTKEVAYIINGKSWVNNHAHVLKVKEGVSSNKFLLHFLNQFDYTNYVGGTTRLKLNQANLRKIPILLPSFQEQERIVAKLDNLLGHLSKIRTKIETLKNLGDKYLNSCIVNLSENAFYPRKKIGQFLEEQTERIGDKWLGLRLIGVSAKEGISELRTGQKKTFEKYKIVRTGDFIYNTMRANIGSIAIYDGEEIALTSPDYVVFRVKNHLSSQLLLRFLKSEQGLLEIGSNTKGSVRARLYFSALSEVRMPIAPESIQLSAEKFLTGFDYTLKQIQVLEKNQLARLPKVILDKAFKGELVEQLTTDSDADELLQNIQKLRTRFVKKPVTATRPKTEKLPAKTKIAVKPAIKLEGPKGVEANFIWHYLRSSFGKEKFAFNQIELPARYSYDRLKDEFFELLDVCRELKKGDRLVQVYNGDQISYQIKLK